MLRRLLFLLFVSTTSVVALAASARAETKSHAQGRTARHRDPRRHRHASRGDRQPGNRIALRTHRQPAASRRHTRQMRAATVVERSPDALPVDRSDTPLINQDPATTTLRAQLASILGEKPLRRAHFGLQVVTAREGKILFARNAQQWFNPASNTKILATAAALTELGTDYRYRTTLHGPAPDDDGVVHGDVELRGSGDPSLGTADLVDLARSLVAAGVRRIDGSLIADGRYHGPAAPAATEPVLFLNRNTYTVTVSPSDPGHAASLSLEPRSPAIHVRGKVITVSPSRRTRLRVDIVKNGDQYVVTVRGRISARGSARVRRRIGDGVLYALTLLGSTLSDYGIEISGGQRRGRLADDTPVLAEHRSAPLAEICRISNKDSNNFVADAIFKTLGGERYGGPPSLEKGRMALAELMTPLGIPPERYRILNGSGLTHENRIAPATLTQLLRHLYFDLSIAPEFLASLSVGGIDGTTRSRFRGTDAAGLVRAKTGTLSGVSALSGYVGKTGDVVIFSILVEGFRRSRLHAVRHAQVRMVQAMLRYLRSAEPGNDPGFIAPSPDADPGSDEDNEDDGDNSVQTGGQ